MSNLNNTKTELLRAAYAAFNSRDIDSALALMTKDVTWPRAFKGGFVVGPDEIRAYWTAQWSEIDGKVSPIAFHSEDDGQILVEVHQVVHNLNGVLLADEKTGHLFAFTDGLISGMTISELPAKMD